MFSLQLHCPEEERDLLIAELAEAGSAGIHEEMSGLRAFFEDTVDAGALLARFAGYAPSLRQEPDQDWEQLSREAWPPLLVGERFYLAPPWCEVPAPEGRILLEINPGMACGTGWHPCTQLCLEALEQNVHTGDWVLDAGSGSGILSLAASLLGADRVIGCDVDVSAVQVARERVPCPAFAGSVDAVRSGSMNVIVANISAPVIKDLALEFARVRSHKSTLILSGFEEWDRIQGYAVKRWLTRDNWLCAIC